MKEIKKSHSLQKSIFFTQRPLPNLFVPRSVSFVLMVSLFFSSLFLFCIVRNGYAETKTTMATARKYYYGLGVPKNSTKAFNLYLQAAQQGDVDGMFVVGGMYMQGIGTDVNQREAFKWLYHAAINGRSSKESQRILGQFFLTGKNVPQNYKEALRWYELAAMGGDAEAQSELAFLYFSGKFVQKDYQKARYWFEEAAKKDYPMAQYNMGLLWYTGNGVEAVSVRKAYAWFNLAAANGNPSGGIAKNYLESMLSKEELTDAQNKSMELFREIKQVAQ